MLLAEDMELNVRITEGEYCKLNIKRGRLPVLSHVTKHMYFYQNDENTIQVEDFTVQNYPKYILIDAVDSGRHSSKEFRYVYSGKADLSKLKKVYFTIPELAAYFNNEISRDLEQNGDLKGNISIEALKTTLMINDELVKIGLHQSYQMSETSTKDGFQFTSSMAMVFEFESAISLNEIEQYLYKSKNIFTWITGYPVKVSKIEVSDGVNYGKLYIPTVKDTSKHNVSHHNCFMWNHQLRSYFADICKGFFLDNTYEFQNIWSRTIPLYSFDGVLEYETMLYAAILDKYCSHKVNELHLDKTLNENEYTELTDRISSLINKDEILANAFSKGVLSDFGNAKVLREALPNRSISTFKQKVKMYLNHIGKDVTTIFISNEDLHSIKEIRDRAAHGEQEKLTTDELSKIYWKLRMLIIYFVYRDLGVTDENFLEMISFSFTPLVLNCEVDKFKLDTTLEKAIVLPVSKSIFVELSSKHQIDRVIVRNGNQYELSEEYTTKLHRYFFVNDFTARKIKSLDEYVKTLLVDSKLDAKYIGEAYIKYGRKTHVLHGIIVVDKPQKLKELTAF